MATLGTEESGGVVEKWLLWGGKGVMWQINFSGGVQHVYCAQFMLTISHNGNPVIYNE